MLLQFNNYGAGRRSPYGLAGTSARESVKEMKRLKNEPLLMLAIIAIILFVGIFVVYPVIRVILFPSGGDLYAAVPESPAGSPPSKTACS